MIAWKRSSDPFKELRLSSDQLSYGNGLDLENNLLPGVPERSSEEICIPIVPCSMGHGSTGHPTQST